VRIAQAAIDVRIVMMTRSAAIPVICPEMPADPLTGTPLASDPRYKFLESNVDSNNLLDVAVDNFGNHADFLRKDAALHFVFVTDDESRYRAQPTPEARAQAFQADVEQLAQKKFVLHTISSDGPTPCRDPNCMPDANTGICVFVMLGCGAAAPGATYYALAHTTNGLTASICESDWQKILQPLTAAVIESARCRATIRCRVRRPASHSSRARSTYAGPRQRPARKCCGHAPQPQPTAATHSAGTTRRGCTDAGAVVSA
jgi:hypothetical protein